MATSAMRKGYLCIKNMFYKLNALRAVSNKKVSGPFLVAERTLTGTTKMNKLTD